MMGRTGFSLRSVALLSAAALTVHEGAYALAGESTLLAAGGRPSHAYLWRLAPVVAVLLAAGFAQLMVALVRAGRGTASPVVVRTPMGVVWMASGSLLSGVWVVQEWLEAALGPEGIAEAFGAAGHSGVAPFILAVAFGGLVALLQRGAEQVVSWVADRPRQLAWTVAPVLVAASGAVRGAVPFDAVARNLAGRGPPLLQR